MKTTLFKKTDDKGRKWFIIDAKDQVLGPLAVEIANKLRGKDKNNFTPHLDCGDYIIVINAEKVKLTGNKLKDKIYRSHSGYLGNLKEVTAGDMLKKKPTMVIKNAVSKMLPKNSLRRGIIKKLKIYAGEVHPHTAQTPIEFHAKRAKLA